MHNCWNTHKLTHLKESVEDIISVPGLYSIYISTIQVDSFKYRLGTEHYKIGITNCKMENQGTFWEWNNLKGLNPKSYFSTLNCFICTN